MAREIGSEFWKEVPASGQKMFFLSGRTALEFIIRDILEGQNISSALLPSYCCHTMIEPFVRHGIQVRFYDVYFDKVRGLCADIPDFQDNEVFYYMTYFGFRRISGIDPTVIRKRYPIIINDSTHSWLSGESALNADYSFTSFRKWSGFSGIAAAQKHHGGFRIQPGEVCSERYVSLREQAFALKQKYLCAGEGDKSTFLGMFSEAESLLETEYIGFRPSYRAVDDFLSTDWSEIKSRRRANARCLIDGLRKCEGIDLVYDQLEDEDTPLFVPILVKKDRDQLCKHLIDQQIYCPVHWPLSDLHRGIRGRALEIYHQELSLLCDQRYDVDDMNRIVQQIANYFG